MKPPRARTALVAVAIAAFVLPLALGAPPAAAFTASPTSVAVGPLPEGAALDAGGSLVVANSGNGTLSVVDTTTMTVTSTITGLAEPSAVAVRLGAGPTEFIVANRFPPSVSRVDAVVGAVTQTYPLPGSSPADILISPMNPDIWFIVNRLGSVIKLDATSGVPLSLPLTGSLMTAQLSADGSRLYVVSSSGDLWDVLTDSMTIVAQMRVPSVNVTDIAIHGRFAYVSSREGTIFRVNTTTGVINTWTVGGSLLGITTAWYGKYLYVADSAGAALAVVKARNGRVVNSFPLAASPDGLVTSPQWDATYALNTFDGSVTRVEIRPDPPGPPQGWVDTVCTRSAGQVAVHLRWRRPSTTGDLALEGYRFRAKRPNRSWTTWQYTVRTETHGSTSVGGYRVGDRIALQIQSLSQAGASSSLRGQCTVTR